MIVLVSGAGQLGSKTPTICMDDPADCGDAMSGVTFSTLYLYVDPTVDGSILGDWDEWMGAKLRGEAPDPARYGWIQPNVVVVASILFTFAVIAPLLTPFAVLYFAGAYVVYKHQLLFVFAPPAQLGGAFFPLLLQSLLNALTASQVVLFGFFLSAQAWGLASFAFPLPFVSQLVAVVEGVPREAPPPRDVARQRLREQRPGPRELPGQPEEGLDDEHGHEVARRLRDARAEQLERVARVPR